MILARSTIRRRILAGLVPAALLGVALTLMAPTCGTMAPGMKTFARQSLIIPMDLCYQNTGDGISTNYAAVGCPSAKTNGDVMKAYGLVYQLVRNNIAVYWVIGQSKAAVTDVDMSVQYNGGPAVLKYDWSAGGTAQGPTLNKVDYRGGPFVVDGSDFARASAVLQAYKATFGAVNVHVSNVAFQGYVAKTMAGGWSAGGTIPPKLALLDIGSDGAGRKNAEPVIQGYLTKAGLDTAGAAGSASGTHGEIYDRLLVGDFYDSNKPNDWTATNLYKNDYQVLWVPHWAAPSSCTDCTGFTSATCACTQKIGPTAVSSILNAIGSFNAAGKDVFAECAGLGSFEGVFKTRGSTTGGFDATYGSAVTSTHFLTPSPSGLWINQWPSGASTDKVVLRTGFSSPFMQIGDFPMVATSGAIEDYKPNAFKTGTITLISDGTYPDYDIFTLLPPGNGAGTVVYLAGHSYSGTDGKFVVAGSRLVLNTLFNLGASCVESGVACNTGELGECAAGVMSCDANGQPYCKRLKSPTAEICDGKDNNCNGLVDEGLDTECYDGPAATKNVGICRTGVSSCVKNSDGTYGMSQCTGQVLPGVEVCNGQDDDCDGRVDNVAGGATALSASCYTGPSDSLDPLTGKPRGICKAGITTCGGGIWSQCQVCPADAYKNPSAYPDCQIVPLPQDCGADGTVGGVVQDMTCSGQISCGCVPGSTQSCYDGPPGTAGVGICKTGQRTCTSNGWGECNGQVTPLSRDCSSALDNDCNGQPDKAEPDCVNRCPAPNDPSLKCLVPGAARNTDGTLTTGSTCRDGSRTCTDGVLSACTGVVLPSPEVCDGKDNNCDGQIDENPDELCGANFTCVSGVCVPSSCGVESKCNVDGFKCDLTTSKCVRDECGGVTCAAGQTCVADHCVDPCEGVQCGQGAICTSGGCTGGGCFVTGCPTGQACEAGTCVTDPCSSSSCPAGTLCRGGDCVQSCVYVKCPTGQVCSVDGFCERDACADVSCAAGQKCVGGACVNDLCTQVACGGGQVCADGACVDDPCNVVTCPVGACAGGQCYPVQPHDKSKASSRDSSSGGCGTGGTGALALLFLAALPLARLRRPFRRSGGGVAAAVIATSLALGGSACQKSKSNLDLSSCTHVCEGVNRCVDLNYESAHCGRCDTACAAGEICADGVCGPSTSTAPYVKSVTPAQGSHGALAPVTVTVSGQRFKVGAELRVVAPGGTTSYPATVTDGGNLTAAIDLTSIPVGEVLLRVVNPDRVVSNGVDFSVVALAPTIDSIDPTAVTVGSTQNVTVHGSGFTTGSVCHSLDGVGNDVGLPTTSNPDGTLSCWVDATSLSPGSYDFWVVNDGMSSNKKPLEVQSATATLVALTPSSAGTGTIQDITITGTGFDLTSKAYFAWGNAVPTVWSNTLYVNSSKLVARSYAIPPTEGSAQVTVRNGSGPASNALTLSALGSVPKVQNLTVTPSPLYQDDTASFTFMGSGSTTCTKITVQPPTGASFDTAASGTAASCTGQASLLDPATNKGRPDGTYHAFVTFTGGYTSSTFPFLVLSNVAVLRSVATTSGTAGGMAGTTVPVTLTASNVRGTTSTVTVLFTGGPDAINKTLTPTLVSPTQVVVSLPLTGLSTGVYQLAIVNAHATASNQVSFSVTPGAPTVTSLSPSCVVQSDTPVQITVTGTNFAKDSAGNPVSQVVYSSDGTNFYSVPGTVSVTDSSHIAVTIDTREAYVVPDGYSTYAIQVWNPPGPMKSPLPNQALKISSTTCP